MNHREAIQKLTSNFSRENLAAFLRLKSDQFRPDTKDYSLYLDTKEDLLSNPERIGNIEFDETQRLIVLAVRSERELTARSCKRRQYEFGRKVLKDELYDAGIFIFHDNSGHFRFSLIQAIYTGVKREYSNYKRFTYYVSPYMPNKTFVNQIGKAEFSSIETIREAFSIEAVSEDFYNEFKPRFDSIAETVIGRKADETLLAQDFALLFVIRVIFLGFVQKKGWLGENELFIQAFWRAYEKKNRAENEFYEQWLEPLFFEALNSGPVSELKNGTGQFPKDIAAALKMAPFLNGELFKRKDGVDDQGFTLPDKVIGDFIDFLFQYNFTIEENTSYDEDLELNPEFLGIIFERLVNKADGAIYTPRTEVDFMCRMALVKWLEKNSSCDLRDLYHLLFREGGAGAEFDEDQKQGDFSSNQIQDLVSLLSNVTICDPAAGSGAFEVGMLHVLNEALESLENRANTPSIMKNRTPFERKRGIIANSLYGVEVKRWAVWINQLRLWLTLFIDMPSEYRLSSKPLLPNLDFKVRSGDSLVQRIGGKLFPVHGHADLSADIRDMVTRLKELKVEFYNNKVENYHLVKQEEDRLFKRILDEEINQRKQEIKANQEPQEGIQTHLGFDKASEVDGYQKYLKLTKDKKNQIEAEIEELLEEKNNLKDEHPLIWSIEFAEIFFEKGGFDIIIGNPPYVRQEDISDPLGDLTPKRYKSELHEMVRTDFPEHFFKKPYHVKNIKEKIDGKSDLYTYFYIRSLHLLNAQGIHVFICSNSWLDVGYGAWVQWFLLNNVPIHFIVDNHAKRSFANADINTIISVLDAPVRNRAKLHQNRQVKFVAFRRSFEEVMISEHLLKIEAASTLIREDAFRMFPVTVSELAEEGIEYEDEETKKGEYIGDKWGGKYLRAPDIFFKILEKGKDKFIRIKEISKVHRGITTGCNEFFYLTEEQAKRWNIENEYLKPVIKSPRECKKFKIDSCALGHWVFMCNKSREKLKGTNALKYIKWGERQSIVIKQGKDRGKRIKGFNNLETVKNRRYWWVLPELIGNTFWVKETNDRLGVFLSKKDMVADCRLYFSKIPHELQLFCNSIIYFLFAETLTRSGLGLGARSLMVYEVNNHFAIKPDVVSVKNSKTIDKMFDREVKPIFIECGIDPESVIPIPEQEPNPLPDRRNLDDIYFDALDLTEDDRKEVYRAVCQLVWNRISKAKSVTKRK